MKRGDKIEYDIIKIVESSLVPVSTREISLRIHKAWHTVDRHCLILSLHGKIKGLRIGNINAWVQNK